MATVAHLPETVAFDGIVACWWGFILTFWLRKRPPRAQTTQKKDATSYVGLLLQALGYFIVWSWPLARKEFLAANFGSGWLAWAIAVVSVAIAAASVAFVIWSARCLGKQWSLEARVVEGHDLIEDGPYGLVRNPIYAGMFGMLVATGLPSGRWVSLLAGAVLLLAGTVIRIRIEERLLREAFGQRFDEYARKVAALVPGIY